LFTVIGHMHYSCILCPAALYGILVLLINPKRSFLLCTTGAAD
jgi:hypothetical protein